MVATELTAALPPAPTSILDRVFPLDQCEELAWVPAAPIYGEFSRTTTDRSAFTPSRTRNAS